MQINSLPAGAAVGMVEIDISSVTLYTKQRSAHKCCFIRHYMQDEMKMQCSIKRSPHLPTIRIPLGGIYFNNILMDHFVISQI